MEPIESQQRLMVTDTKGEITGMAKDKKIELYIADESNEKDGLAIGINEGDISAFLAYLEEYKRDLENACIPVSSFEIMLDLFKHTKIYYRTEDSFYNGNILYIIDEKAFYTMCKEKKETPLFEAWLNILRGIVEDVDIIEMRYNQTVEGAFLRHLLVFLMQFTLVTKLRDE